MSYVDDLFTLIQFYDDNKDVIGTDTPPTSNVIVYSTTTKMIDPVIIQTAIESKQTALGYFQNVLDVPAYNTNDYNRLRRFFIDWYSANKTLIKINSASTNAYSMSSALLDEIIKGFGFNYSYLIQDTTTKAAFLLSLVNLYKIKGTPICLSDALKFFGYTNTAIYEWWIVRKSQQIYFEGRLTDTEESFLTQFPSQRFMSWSSFQDVNDGHWYYTEAQLLALDTSPTRYIGLPSLSPYFTLSNLQTFDNIDSLDVIISRMLSDQWTNFKTTAGQPPKDILVQSGQFYLSILELYLGILYSYWKYNDWMKYSALYLFIANEFALTPETDYLPFVYSEPYAYEKLLYWCSIRTNSLGVKQPLDIKDANPNNPDMLHPISGIGFNPYPPQMELWNSLNQPDLSSGFSDSSFNYDKSVIDYDGSIFYPVLNNLPQFDPSSKYLHDNKSDFPNYNDNFDHIPGFLSGLQSQMDDFTTLITTRPTSRQDAKDKLDLYNQNYARLQTFNFILNQLDPQRILGGIPPVATIADLSNIPTIQGTTVLVRNSPTGPQVYIYTGSDWQVMTNGFTEGKLGLNPTLLTWIDNQTVGNKSNYISVVNNLMSDLDIFISTYLKQTKVKLNVLLLGIDEVTQLDPIVNFFKPEKSRLLAFEILFNFNQALENSINLDDTGDADSVNLTLPEEMPETLRGGYPENYDTYTNGYDANEVFDNVDIFVYQDDGFGGTVLVPQSQW